MARSSNLEASISRATVGDQVVLTAILRDITERVRGEAELLRHRFELSALTRELLEQEKRTTQRLAQALHDQLGQTLAALRLALERDQRTPAADQAEAARRFTQSLALVDEAVGQVRKALVDLRPGHGQPQPRALGAAASHQFAQKIEVQAMGKRDGRHRCSGLGTRPELAP